MMQSTRRVRRVFIGPVEIAGIAAGIAHGLRARQVDARLMLSTPHPFKYGDGPDCWLTRVWQGIGAARAATPRRHLLRKTLYSLAHALWGWVVFAHVVASFDACIYLFGETITNSEFELWLLKRLGKRIIFIYVGSDSRPPYMNGVQFPGSVSEGLRQALWLYVLARRTKRRIRLHERYADYLVNSPATAHFHERPYINWFAMGIPRTSIDEPEHSHSVPARTGPVRVLHSPSNPRVKGTAEILAALDRLREKGHLFEFIKIEGMSNEVVLRGLARCDFVVDQLYADTPLAVFATEAAILGKPAVVGGYFADSVPQCLSESELPPSMFVSPRQLESAIERLLVDTDFRQALGARAKQFVLTHWGLSCVADRYLRLLNGDVPSSWWCDPASVNYLSGCGLPEERTKRLVALLVDRFGASALQLDDKPALKAALVAFSRSREDRAHA